jgi:hypothetical protein
MLTENHFGGSLLCSQRKIANQFEPSLSRSLPLYFAFFPFEDRPQVSFDSFSCKFVELFVRNKLLSNYTEITLIYTDLDSRNLPK